MASAPIFFPLFDYDALAAKLRGKLGKVNVHYFPDGECLTEIETPIEGSEVIFVCSLDQPNLKALPLLFASKTARDLGATKIGLIAPYLAYMRQDKIFHPGEGLTSAYFADLISTHFDWLSTVDPHLHRWKSLSDLYKIPTKVVHATAPIASWIKKEIQSPVLIGPDAESEQWVAQIANAADCPYVICMKNRRGDSDVQITLPEMVSFKDHQPVLVDDIISSAVTMIETVNELNRREMKRPVCIGVHALFAGDAYERLEKSGVLRIVTCNTVNHPTNEIDLSSLLL